VVTILLRMSLGKAAVSRASEVFGRADLGDARLVRRAVALAEALAVAPNQSLPKVWSTPAELEAAYRFLRNPSTGFEQMMDPVQQATRERVLEKRRILALHDTTDIACQSADPEEVGYLQTGKAGFYVHHTLCVGCDDVIAPLGVLWSQLWGRPQRSSGRGARVSGSELAKRDQRESDRWLEAVTEAQLWAEGCDQMIHVMDREADSYRLFEHLRQHHADFVVRLRHDRRAEDGYITDALYDAPVRLRRTVPLSPRRAKTMPSYTHKGRNAREASLVVRCATVEIQPPHYMRLSEPVTLNVVQVLEESPASGDEPVAWVLATSLPIDTAHQIAVIIDFYRARWLIEEFHKALKTGCLVEKRQLESFESITTLLALCYPIACEILSLRSRARQPDLPAAAALRPSLLHCLRAHPKARPLPENPTAEQAMSVIAGLGGHIKHNGPPGWQTLAAGYAVLLAFEQGWLAAIAHRDL
jgi:hypothetical protein